MYPYTHVQMGRGKEKQKHHSRSPYCLTNFCQWTSNTHCNSHFGLVASYSFKKKTALLWSELISSSVPPTWLHKHHTLLPSCDALCTLEKPTVNHKSLSSVCATSCLCFAQEASRRDSFLPSPFPLLPFSLPAPPVHWTALIKPTNADMWSS